MKSKSGFSPWPPAQRIEMRARLAEWYERARRDLPWRRTRDPYAIAVSELMLQQTQVATVIPYFERWLLRFPTWTALAGATEPEILKAWEGLGYYRRARQLWALAQWVVAHGDALPRRAEELLPLPGIGPYTAAAISSIAHGEARAVLDGNVMRVLTRLLALHDDIALAKTRGRLQLVADSFLDPCDPGRHNQAVMELGATVCRPRQPLCLVCPLARFCRGQAEAETLPVKTRVAIVRRDEAVALIRQGDSFYAEPVPAGVPWHGLWRLPLFDPKAMTELAVFSVSRYGITKYAVTLRVISARWRRPDTERTGRFLSAAEFELLPFAAPHRKVLQALHSKH